MKQITKILVLKLDFIGDFITVLPAIRLLRQSFPAAQISLACTSVVKDLAEKAGYFDQIYTFEFFGIVWENQDALFHAFQSKVPGSYDLVIDFRVDAETRPLLLAVHTMIRAGIGTAEDFPYLDIALPSIRDASRKPQEPPKEAESTKEVASPRPFLIALWIWWIIIFIPRMLCRTILDFIRYVDFLLKGCPRPAKSPQKPKPKPKADLWIGEYILLLTNLCVYRLKNMELFQSPELIQTGSAKPPARTIYIAPFSNSETRTWPAVYFRQLLLLILERTDHDVVMLGSLAQAPFIDTIIEGMPAERVRNIAGNLTLIGLSSLLIQGTMVITNNSGLAHLGAAVGAQVLAIFSASHQIEEWGPRGPNVTTLTTQVDCGACSIELLGECKHDHNCMRLITPEAVFAYLDNILSGANIPKSVVPPELRRADGLTVGRFGTA
jgi:ADP-heptose:LPS heptosyltransferase